MTGGGPGEENIANASSVVLDGLRDGADAVNVVADDLFWLLSARGQIIHHDHHRGVRVTRLFEFLHNRANLSEKPHAVVGRETFLEADDGLQLRFERLTALSPCNRVHGREVTLQVLVPGNVLFNFLLLNEDLEFCRVVSQNSRHLNDWLRHWRRK